MDTERPAAPPTIDALLRESARRLGPIAESARLEAELLLAHALGKERKELYLALFKPVPADALEAFTSLIGERLARRPLAQLVGRRDFWTFDLEVTNGTLVPRADTEVLVERTLLRVAAGAPTTVLDLGTGTGAIAIAVALERPTAQVTATDLSKSALPVARRNARRLGVRNVKFRQGDWFAPLKRTRFDVITSNPPYIADDEWDSVAPELSFEPTIALRAGPDGLAEIRQIVAGAADKLQPGGWLLLEHGLLQGDAVARLLRDAGFREVQTIADHAGRPRVTEGRLAERAAGSADSGGKPGRKR
jgi:release factor glutamine methyltransferase